jgi:hypothetical protein
LRQSVAVFEVSENCRGGWHCAFWFFALEIKMKSKYEFIFDAHASSWKATLKSFFDEGKGIAIVGVEPKDIRDCVAIAQEHDFTCVIEDKEITPDNYPETT